MKKNLTYIIFLIDRSGSMSSIANDMIGGFNSFIKTQKEIPGDASVFLYQFDTQYETVFENIPLSDVGELTDKTYIPRGGTALYSSMGKTIVDIGTHLNNLFESERPERVLFVTITDGQNNSLLLNEEKQYSSEDVKTLVKQQTDVYKRDFAYIGANQDAWAVGGSMGVTNNLNYKADSSGTKLAFSNLISSTNVYRSAATKNSFSFASNPTVDVVKPVNLKKKTKSTKV